MSDEQVPFLTRNKLLIISIIISISLVVSVLIYLNFQVDDVIPVVIKEPEPVEKEMELAKDTRFNVANFDICVGLLIDYTGVHDSTDELIQASNEASNEIKKADILADYYELNCNLVEIQLSQTDAYKHRNDLP